MSRNISEKIRETVRRRADSLCEYCHTNERWQYVRFTIDHIIPNKDNSIENLALACFHRNRRKSNKTDVSIQESSEPIPLFSPRRHIWSEHFKWSPDGLRIISRTAIGKATIDLLELNRERILFVREADVAVNRHPPVSDLTEP